MLLEFDTGLGLRKATHDKYATWWMDRGGSINVAHQRQCLLFEVRPILRIQDVCGVESVVVIGEERLGVVEVSDIVFRGIFGAVAVRRPSSLASAQVIDIRQIAYIAGHLSASYFMHRLESDAGEGIAMLAYIFNNTRSSRNACKKRVFGHYPVMTILLYWEA
jgi:hypothetical protein